MSYAVYLIHLWQLIGYFGSLHDPRQFNFNQLWHEFLSNLVVVFFFAFWVRSRPPKKKERKALPRVAAVPVKTLLAVALLMTGRFPCTAASVHLAARFVLVFQACLLIEFPLGAVIKLLFMGGGGGGDQKKPRSING